MAIQKLGHVGIYANDLQNMRDFYSRVIGLHIADETPSAVFMSSDPDREHHEFVIFKSSGPEQQTCVQQLSFSCEKLEDVAPEIRDYIIYEHVFIAAGLGLGEECLAKPDPMGYRIHQWEKTDYGVVGKSSAIGTRKKETVEDGKVWAAHCLQEIGNWGVFLPQLYTLYKVVTDTNRNPFADLSLEGRGRAARYRYIK